VVGLVTQPDKKVGRKQILTPPDTKKYLLDNGIDMDIYQPQTLKSEEALEKIKSYKADFIVVAAYGQILPKSILDVCPCINLHASILPAYRGASPIQDAIKNQDVYSGVTAMLMDIGLDTGDILGFSYLNIEKLNASELFEQLSYDGAKLTIDILKNFESISPIAQNGCEATYSKKITKDDGLLDLLDAKSCEAKFRAFIFWPGVVLESGLKLKEISLYDSKSENRAGEILSVEKDSIVLGCQIGSLRVTRVQPPSKKEMSVIDYIRGKRFGVGDNLS
jgi:methionyl-tRNA formyltransferase